MATYEIRIDGGTDFFDAYVDALKRAFVELAAENPALIELLDKIFADAFREACGEPPGFWRSRAM